MTEFAKHSVECYRELKLDGQPCFDRVGACRWPPLFRATGDDARGHGGRVLDEARRAAA